MVSEILNFGNSEILDVPGSAYAAQTGTTAGVRLKSRTTRSASVKRARPGASLKGSTSTAGASWLIVEHVHVPLWVRAVAERRGDNGAMPRLQRAEVVADDLEHVGRR